MIELPAWLVRVLIFFGAKRVRPMMSCEECGLDIGFVDGLSREDMEAMAQVHDAIYHEGEEE